MGVFISYWYLLASFFIFFTALIRASVSPCVACLKRSLFRLRFLRCSPMRDAVAMTPMMRNAPQLYHLLKSGSGGRGL